MAHTKPKPIKKTPKRYWLTIAFDEKAERDSITAAAHRNNIKQVSTWARQQLLTIAQAA